LMKSLKSTVLALSLLVGAEATCDWSYAGHRRLSAKQPHEWHTCTGYEACGGTGQSPIDVTAASVTVEHGLSALKASWGPCVPHCDLYNIGYTLRLSYSGEGTINLGDLPSRHFGNSGSSIYDLLRIDFHWGNDAHHGSEHTVQGHSYPLEMQMVHTQRGNMNPMTSAGGLAVLSVMFKVGAAHPALQSIIDAVPSVVAMPTSVSSPFNATTISGPVDVQGLFPYERIDEYLTYQGSMTTPGCEESVNWLLAATPMSLSQAQLDTLRSIEHSPGTLLSSNYRPTQMLNGRRVLATSADSLPTLSAGNAPELSGSCTWTYGTQASSAGDSGHRRMDSDFETRRLAPAPSTVAPDKWHTCLGNEACMFNAQSPIDVVATAVGVDHTLPTLEVHWMPCQSCTLLNNGHTLQMNYNSVGHIDIGDLGQRLFGLRSGSSEYDLLEINWHWSDHDFAGSEHTVEGLSYPLEMHMVHQQRGNPDPFHTPGGLVVLGVMFKVGAANTAIQPIIDGITDVKGYTGSALNTTLAAVNVSDLYPFDVINDYLAYAGSLTTPGCYESVNWLLAGNPMSISAEQLAELRSAEHSAGHVIGHNYRPTQPLNGRTVHATSRGVQKVLAMSAEPNSHCDVTTTTETTTTRTTHTTTSTPDPGTVIAGDGFYFTAESIVRTVVVAGLPTDVECKSHDAMLGILITAMVLAFVALLSLCGFIFIRYREIRASTNGGGSVEHDSSSASITATLMSRQEELRSKASKINDALGGLDKIGKDVATTAEQCSMNNKALSTVDGQVSKLLEHVTQIEKQGKTMASSEEMSELTATVDKVAESTSAAEQKMKGSTLSSSAKASIDDVRKKADMVADLLKMMKTS